MERVDDGGPAFPRTGYYPDTVGVHREDLSTVLEHKNEPEQGMSLRDWFAGQALAGYLAAHADSNVGLPRAARAADRCYQYADAMLKARSGADLVEQLGTVPPIPPIPTPPSTFDFDS